MRLKSFIRNILEKSGYSISRNPTSALLTERNVSLVLDVGANRGQFAKEIRQKGHSGRIVSFEPLSEVRKSLEREAINDPQWRIEPFALGDRDDETEINVAANTESSSLLEMLPAHRKADPNSCFAYTERVKVCRLDSVFNNYYKPNDVVYLKLDTQGFERQVLNGATNSLQHVQILQVEASLIPLYDGESLIEELITWLRNRGFLPVDLRPTFRNPFNLHLLQCDAVFLKV